MKTRDICILTISLLLIAASHVMADELMCGSNIINIGDRSNDVLRKCGEPAYIETREEVRTRRDSGSFQFEPEKRIQIGPLFVQELVTIEEWEYNLGPTRFIRYLRFENGRLVSITTGDYGY